MNEPIPIAVHRYIRLPVPIIVCRYWHVSRDSPAYRRHPSIRRAKNKPCPVAVDSNITPAVAVKVNGSRLTRDYKPTRDYKDLAQTEGKDIKQTIRSDFKIRDSTKSAS